MAEPTKDKSKSSPAWLLAVFFAAVLAVGGYLTWQALAPSAPLAPVTGGPGGADSSVLTPGTAALPELVAAERRTTEARLRELLAAAEQDYRSRRYPAAAAACREILSLTGWDRYTQLSFATLGNINDDLHEYADAAFCYRQALRVGADPDLFFNLALTEYHRRSYRAAAEAAARSLGLAPDRPESRLLAGMIKAAQNDLAGAVSDLQSAAADTGSFAAACNLAEALARQGDRAAAIRELTRAIALPAPAGATRAAALRLAELHAAADNPAAAAELYRQLLPRTPTDPFLLQNFGIVLLRSNRFDEAAAILARAVQLDPGRADAWFALADALTGAGNLPAAVGARRRGLELDSINLAQYYRLGEQFLEVRDPDGARKTFRQVTELGENSPLVTAAYVRLGLLYQQQGKYEEALARFNEALARAPEEALIHFDLGRCERGRGRHAAATAAFQRARSRAPKEVAYARAVADSLFSENKYVEAIHAYEDLLEVSPGNVAACVALGYLHQQRRDWAAARRWYAKGLSLGPEPAALYELLVNFARVAAEEQQEAEAFALLRRAAEVQRERPEAYLHAAFLHRRRSDLGEAFANLAVARRLAPNRPDVHRLLGACYLDKGLPAEARAAYEKALALDPTDLEARAALDSIK